jgi:hypothetical protein
MTGFEELDRKMKRLPLVFTHKIVGSAIFKSAKPAVDATKMILLTKTKRRTGNLVESIGRVRTPIKKANEIGEVKVGPRVGGRYKGFHGHLIEFGTKDRYTKANKYTGRGPRLPYIAPAFAQTHKLVLSNVEKNMWIIIRRYLKTGIISEIPE